ARDAALGAMRPAAAALLLAACGAANAQPSWEVSASGGLLERTLSEIDDSGTRLVRERGPLAFAALEAARGALSLHGRIAGGRPAYDGRTQGGVPIESRTTHEELELGAAWRLGEHPVAGALAIEVAQLQFRRVV